MLQSLEASVTARGAEGQVLKRFTTPPWFQNGTNYVVWTQWIPTPEASPQGPTALVPIRSSLLCTMFPQRSLTEQKTWHCDISKDHTLSEAPSNLSEPGHDFLPHIRFSLAQNSWSSGMTRKMNIKCPLACQSGWSSAEAEKWNLAGSCPVQFYCLIRNTAGSFVSWYLLLRGKKLSLAF